MFVHSKRLRNQFTLFSASHIADQSLQTHHTSLRSVPNSSRALRTHEYIWTHQVFDTKLATDAIYVALLPSTDSTASNSRVDFARELSLALQPKLYKNTSVPPLPFNALPALSSLAS